MYVEKRQEKANEINLFLYFSKYNMSKYKSPKFICHIFGPSARHILQRAQSNG